MPPESSSASPEKGSVWPKGGREPILKVITGDHGGCRDGGLQLAIRGQEPTLGLPSLGVQMEGASGIKGECRKRRCPVNLRI